MMHLIAHDIGMDVDNTELLDYVLLLCLELQSVLLGYISVNCFIAIQGNLLNRNSLKDSLNGSI